MRRLNDTGRDWSGTDVTARLADCLVCTLMLADAHWWQKKKEKVRHFAAVSTQMAVLISLSFLFLGGVNLMSKFVHLSPQKKLHAKAPKFQAVSSRRTTKIEKVDQSNSPASKNTHTKKKIEQEEPTDPRGSPCCV